MPLPLPRHTRATSSRAALPLFLAAFAAAAVLITGCSQQQPNRTPTRFAPPPPPPAPAPAAGQTDWDAVVAALGGAGKKAGSGAKTAWASTGGRAIDLAAGLVIHNMPGHVSACGFAWPAKGKISRGFRPAENHKGLDVMAEVGTPIHAARAGRVIYADNELSGFGNCIIIEHDNGLSTFYAHNDRNLVKSGDHVRCGQLIAEVGQTGRASGPHLHFEIRQNGTPMDPHPMLP